MPSPAERAAFVDFIRAQTRFNIGGSAASEGVVRRLAAILETQQAYERFRIHVRDWSRNHDARSWGAMIWLAEDSIVKRPEPAKQEPLPFNIVSIAEAKRMPAGRIPKVDERVSAAVRSTEIRAADLVVRAQEAIPDSPKELSQ